MARKRKAKSKGWVVMILFTLDSERGKLIQVEVKAPDERRARSEALAFCRSVYKGEDGAKCGYYIKAVSGLTKDGILEDNGVLEYKADEILTRGSNQQDIKPPKAKQGALVPVSKAAAPAAVVVDYTPFENPLTEAIIKLVCRKDVIEYGKDNIRLGDN